MSRAAGSIGSQGAVPLRRILVAYDNPVPPARTRLTILQHLKAIELAPCGPEVEYWNLSDELPDWRSPAAAERGIPARLADRNFDAVLLHYSLLGVRNLGRDFFKLKKALAWLPGLGKRLAAIPQDEPDCCEILDEWLVDWGVGVVFSVQYREGGKLYPRTARRARMVRCLSGYIDEAAAARLAPSLRPLAERSLDVAYRVRQLPLRYGTAGAQKYELGVRARALAGEMGLRADIEAGPEAVVLGDSWMEFLAGTRVALGAEGGFSTLDPRGECKARIAVWEADHPGAGLAALRDEMGPDWDRESMMTVTPRHFDAVVARTAQILIAGEYRGVLRPNDHYIPVRPDFSDLGEALAACRDLGRLQALVDRADAEILGSGKYGYRAFAALMEAELFPAAVGSGPVAVQIPAPEPKDAAALVLERELIALRHELALAQTRQTEAQMLDLVETRMAAQLARAKRQLAGVAVLSAVGTVLAVLVLSRLL